MPLLSAFTMLGHLRLTSRAPHGELLYRAKVNALGGQFDMSIGSRMDALCYAQAMGEARVRYKLDRAGDQVLPMRLVDCLAKREAEFAMVPGQNDTMQQRRFALAARYVLPGGANKNNVLNALTVLLGSKLVAYRTTTLAEIVTSPTTMGDQPMNLQRHDVPRKVARLTIPVAIPGGVTLASVEMVTPNVFAVGDVVVVDAETTGMTERVTVASVSSDTLTIGAAFVNAHGAGATVTTQPFPDWQSTQRRSLIVLTASVALDPSTRQQVNALLTRVVRAVSTWGIVQQTTTGHTGPFVINVSPLGATTIGDVTI